MKRRDILLGGSANAGFLLLNGKFARVGGKFAELGSSSPPPSGNGAYGPAGSAPVSVTGETDEPMYFQLDDWSTGSAVTVATIALNNRVADFTFQDAAMASDVGAVPIVRSTQKIVCYDFEFGVQKKVYAPARNATNPSLHLFECPIAIRPVSDTVTPVTSSSPNKAWTSYPAYDTYDITTMKTHPSAFKGYLLRADHSVLWTYEVQTPTGGPINGPLQSQHRTLTLPLEPWMVCTQFLPYRSGEFAVLPGWLHNYPGPDPEGCRDSVCKATFSTNAIWPMVCRDDYITTTGTSPGGNLVQCSPTDVTNKSGNIYSNGPVAIQYLRAYDGATINSGLFNGAHIIGWNTTTGTMALAPQGIPVTATIVAGVMTVTVISSPVPLAVGMQLLYSGLTLPVYISSLGTGTGGTGTYNLSNGTLAHVSFGLTIAPAATFTGTCSGTTLTVTSDTASPISINSVLMDPNGNVTPGVRITGFGTGTGLTGTYTLSAPLTIATAQSFTSSIDITGAALSSGCILGIGGQLGGVNGLNDWWCSPEWPQEANNSNSLPGDPNNDPYAFAVATTGNSGFYLAPTRISGWNYSPGLTGCHDLYTGPGGPRTADRSVIPTALAVWMAQPTGTYLRDASSVGAGDGTPTRTRLEAWDLSYANEPTHWVTDVQSFATVDESLGAAGLWGAMHGYYGGAAATGFVDSTTYVPIASGNTSAKQNSTDFFVLPNGTGFPESSGYQTLWEGADALPVFNGWSLDAHHSYCMPAIMTMAFGSVTNCWSAKNRYFVHWAAQLGSSQASANPTGYFGIRVMAWRWGHMATMWKCGSTHDLGIDQAIVFDRFVAELQQIYVDIVIPYNDNTNQTPYFLGLRRFGYPGGIISVDGLQAYGTNAGVSPGLQCYIAGVLMLMRQTGLMAALMAYTSTSGYQIKNSAGVLTTLPTDATLQALTTTINIYCTATLSQFANGGCLQNTGQQFCLFSVEKSSLTISDFFNDWSDEAAVYGPNAVLTTPTGYQTAIGSGTGSSQAGFLLLGGVPKERSVNQHWLAQFADIWDVFLSDLFPNADGATGVANVKSWYATWLANVNAQSTPPLKTAADFADRNWQQGWTLPPDHVGP